MESYLTFTLNETEYGINVNDALNIEEVTKLFKQPGLPNYIKGVIKKNNNTIPVIDLKMKLGIGETKNGVFTSLILVKVNHKEHELRAALLTDGVQSVLEFKKEDLIPYTDKKIISKHPYYKGKVKYQNESIKVLDINLIFTNSDLQKIASLTQTEQNRILTL